MEAVIALGNVHDSMAFDTVHDRVTKVFSAVGIIVAGSAYKPSHICKKIFDDGRMISTSYKRPQTMKGGHEWWSMYMTSAAPPTGTDTGNTSGSCGSWQASTFLPPKNFLHIVKSFWNRRRCRWFPPTRSPFNKDFSNGRCFITQSRKYALKRKESSSKIILNILCLLKKSDLRLYINYQ